MVTTRSQDKMTFADKIRAKGFSLADCKFFKLNALFPIMLGLAHATVALWCGSGLAAAVVAAIPVSSPSKVPLFTVFFLPVYAILLSIIALEGLAALAPNGYQSQIGRAAKAPGAIEELGFPGSGWIERVQSSQYNTWESAILAVCCFVVAIEEKLTPSLFSELAALLLVCRLVYPLPYALDVDLVRTQVWLTGLYATIMVAACAMYPETMQPLFA